jgi:hypothetical protein
MLKALSTPGNRRRTFILFAVCGLLGVGAAAVGISDNPPGLLLAFLSASAFIVAFVHPWRASKCFRRLIYVSGLGFIVSAILHNVLHGVASQVGASNLVRDLIGGAGVLFFLVAIFLCPPGILIGVIGAVVMSRRACHSRTGTPPA